MVVLLQLSDLHRSTSDPVGNAELIAALESDRVRWPPALAKGPDLIAISGDLVQGVALGAADPDAQLHRQYDDAGAFLDELVQRFLAGDRSRLILVPGNHDVDWCTARGGMAVVDDDELSRVGTELPWKTLDPTSPYRWSWSERTLYKITDPVAYQARCERFLAFRRDFYAGVDPDPLRVGPDLVFLDLPQLDVSVTGLSSWYGNDCFCHVGAFDPEVLASARDAIARSPCSLHIAVWHHSTSGPPEESDFIDVRQVHRLIDYGFRVGLHGHHHRTDAAVMSLKLPTQEEFALVSAGSLAAGGRELPAGVHRQYTVMEIDPSDRRLRVHVREAISDLVFAGSARTELGGNSYVDLTWTPAPPSPGRVAGVTRVIDDAYRAFAEHDHARAAELLRSVPPQPGAARKLRVDVLAELAEWAELVEFIGAPETQEELMLLSDALCRLGWQQQARAVLDEHGPLLGLSADLRSQLGARIAISEKAP